MLGGLGAAKTGRAAAVTVASGEAAAEKPTAGWPPAAAARNQEGKKRRWPCPTEGYNMDV